MGKLFALRRRSKKEHMPAGIAATANGSIVPTVVGEDASSHSKGRSLRIAVNVKTTLSKWRKRVAKAPTTEALCITAAVLSEVATMTQGVPYIQTLSNLITYVISVNDDIDLLKFERGLLRDKVLQLQVIIDETERRLGPNVDLPMDLQEPFRMLESVLLQVIRVLEKCDVKGPFGQAKLLVSRKDLMKKIERCDAELKTALTCFDITLQIFQSLDINGIETNLGIVSEKVDGITEAIAGRMRSQGDGKVTYMRFEIPLNVLIWQVGRIDQEVMMEVLRRVGVAVSV